jgi:hypothetical protein
MTLSGWVLEGKGWRIRFNGAYSNPWTVERPDGETIRKPGSNNYRTRGQQGPRLQGERRWKTFQGAVEHVMSEAKPAWDKAQAERAKLEAS